MEIFSLLSYALNVLFYGVLSTAVVMTLLYIVFRVLNSGIVKTITFYSVGVVLFFLLCAQFTLLIGAVEANSAVDSMEITINQLMEDQYGTFTATESQELFDTVVEDYPIIGAFMNVCDFSGQTTETIATAMADSAHEYLSSYIWHRVFWILVFVSIASAIVIIFRKKDTFYEIDPNNDLGLY